MRRILSVLATFFLFACDTGWWTCLSADEPQDVVYLKDGTTREGIVDEETPSAIRLKGRLGAIWIERRDIVRIEKAPSPQERFQKRRAELEPDDIEGHFKLALWCKENKLAEEAQQLLLKVIELEPDHAGARKELGQIKVDGKWVSEEEHMRAKGFVRYKNKWLLPAHARIAELTDDYLADRKTREMVFSALNELGDSCWAVIRDVVTADLAALPGLLAEAQLHQVRKELKITYQRLRSSALALITDPARYNDREDTHAARTEVRNLIVKIKQLFNNPLEYYMEHTEDLREVTQRLGLLADYCRRKYPDIASTAKEKLDAARTTAALVLNRSIFENDDTLFPFAKENRAIAAANIEAEKWLKPEEVECIRMLNSYRHMMGLRMLRADERLTRAARKHSREMTEKNYFSHYSPVPELRDVYRRAEAEGFHGLYVGENIAKGEFSLEEIYRAWRESPGHHRNLLNPVYYTVGVGKDGKYWTVVFGGKERR